ncbi:MAG: hypothetical protein QXJ93_02920 [Candidatus Rehaiarchaeum fermentans]|nr:hypothetical protein [Candidatus Rehaiarchaeum fermentans]
MIKLYEKYGLKYFMCPPTGIYPKLFKEGYNYIEIHNFSKFSAEYTKRVNGEVYDETFVNTGKDADLSLKLSFINRNAVIDYKIGDYMS